MLKIIKIKKNYGKKTALKEINLTFEKGVYGLLGPNGAGKSTLMNIITDNLASDSGEVLWNGQPISKLGIKYRRILGFTPQQQGLYNEFTGRRFLHYLAILKEIPKVEIKKEILRVAQLVNLTNELDKRLGAYSGGMKQRILIAQAILGNPQLVIMDEPTAGLDPKERVRIRELLRELGKDCIVLVATHVVSDIEPIANVILIQKKGEIIAQGSPESLLQQFEECETIENVYMKLFGDEVNVCTD